jgi:hypothetical protein
MAQPLFWLRDPVLRPAVEAYLRGGPMTAIELAGMRAYLRRWMTEGAWQGEGIMALRAGVEALSGRETIDDWLDAALDLGIDPL